MRILIGWIHLGPPITIVITITITVDLIKNQNKPHGEGTVESGLEAEREDVLAKHHVGRGIHFASDLGHQFLRRVVDRAASIGERPFDLVFLARAAAAVQLHRHGRPSDY